MLPEQRQTAPAFPQWISDKIHRWQIPFDLGHEWFFRFGCRAAPAASAHPFSADNEHRWLLQAGFRFPWKCGSAAANSGVPPAARDPEVPERSSLRQTAPDSAVPLLLPRHNGRQRAAVEFLRQGRRTDRSIPRGAVPAGPYRCGAWSKNPR